MTLTCLVAAVPMVPAAERTVAEIRQELREQASISLSLLGEMVFTTKNAYVRFSVVHYWDMERMVEDLQRRLAANADSGLNRSNVVVLQRLSSALKSLDARQSNRYRDQRERLLKRLYSENPDDLELAVSYAEALPGYLNYKKRSIFRALAEKFPQRAEPLVGLAGIVFGEFIRKSLGVTDGNWFSALFRLKALSRDPKRNMKPFAQKMLREMKVSRAAATEILERALKRDPDNVEARFHKKVFEWLERIFLAIEEVQEKVTTGEDPTKTVRLTSDGILEMLRESVDLIRVRHAGEPFEYAAPLAIDVMGKFLEHMFEHPDGDVLTSLRTLAPRWREHPEMVADARAGLQRLGAESSEPKHRASALFWLGLIDLVEGKRESGLRHMEASLLADPFEALAFYSYERGDKDEYEPAIVALEAALAKRETSSMRIYLSYVYLRAGAFIKASASAAWFRREMPTGGIAELIEAAVILRRGDATAAAEACLEPVVRAVMSEAAEVARMSKSHRNDAVISLMICRALNGRFDEFDRLAKWCRETDETKSRFNEVVELAGKLRP